MAPQSRSFLKTPIDKLPFQNSTPLFLVCLALILFSNILFSYFQIPLALKIQLVLLGMALPLFLLFQFHGKGKDLFRLETSPAFSGTFWILLAATALFIRFFHLTSLSWPVVDEGIGGYFAARLTQHWDWNLLQGPSQAPRLYTWFQTGIFKLFPSSLFSLRLEPALWSALTLPVAWLAARRLFSRSLSALFLFLLAFGFWPLLLGRYSTQSVFMVFWECLCLWLLARYLGTASPKTKGWQALGLGVGVGIGFYTYLSWPLVALMILAAILFRPKGSDRWTPILLFLLPIAAALLPWIFSINQEYRGYFHHLWNGNWKSGLDRASIASSYFRDLFWGAPGGSFHFGPVWGGLLNPVTTSLFFLGLVPLVQTRRDPRARWFGAALVLFFLPAILTNNFEMMRLCQLTPLLLFVGALGAQFLLSRSGKRGPLLLTILLLGSCSLDLYHLFSAVPRHGRENPAYYGDHKSVEFVKAYRLLNEKAAKEGPGQILLNFNPDPFDQTLFVGTYTFNSAENPGLDTANAKWAAVLTNIHEEALFKKTFPEGNWIWLSEGRGKRDGGFILEMVPVTPQNAARLKRWAEADRSLNDLTYLVMELGLDPDQNQMLAVLDKAYPSFKGDPLLESRFWRIRALHELANDRTEEAILDEQKALERGAPMAHLYNEMGCLLFKEKNVAEAKKAFEKAIQCRPNCTDAAQNLKALTTE